MNAQEQEGSTLISPRELAESAWDACAHLENLNNILSKMDPKHYLKKKTRLIRVDELPFPCLVNVPFVEPFMKIITSIDSGKLGWLTKDNKLTEFTVEELVKLNAQWAAPCSKLSEAVWNSFLAEDV